MKFKHLLWVVPAVLTLSACSDDSDYDFAASEAAALEEAAQTAAATANFDPAAGDIPFPNNLLFNGSEDGTLNIPLGEVDPADFTSPLVSLNAIDGFSTTEPFALVFSNDIDSDSLVLGETVHAFEVTADLATSAVTGITRSLTAADVALTVAGGNTLALIPLQPLKESTDYMVIVTNGVTNTSGVPSTASPAFLLARGTTPLSGEAAPLEPVRQLVNTMITAAEPEGVVRGSVIQAWTAKTQSITTTMQAVKDQTSPAALQVAPSGFATNQLSPLLPGIADVYVGSMELPYYRTAASNTSDTAAITSFWQGPGNSNVTRFNPTPIATSTQTVPVLMSVPNASSGLSQPADGWPVAIFVHGVTRDRTIMLGVADSMAQAGFAVIGIDLPMHGITDTTNPLKGAERTFDLDLVNNTTGAPGPDGIIDGSGTHFYSPRNLLATRDNLRQGIADLLVLSASLDSINGIQLDTSSKALIAHSLGGAIAVPFLALDDSITSTTLGMPAAGLTRTLVASPAFGPPFIAGLAAAGLTQGTPEFEQFVTAAQTLVDAGDAINYTAMAAVNSPIHIIEIVGDGADVLPDQTAPNNIPTAPLAGTDPLARLLGFDPANPTAASTAGSGLVQFIAGEHSSLVSAGPSLAATTEMHRQITTFAVSKGTSLPITDTSVIKGAATAGN